MQQTEKYWNLINRIVVVAIIVMAGVGIALAFTPKVKQMQTYQERRDNLQHRVEVELSVANDYKEKQHRFVSDSDFVERIAHERGYAHKTEIIFQFSDEAGGH